MLAHEFLHNRTTSTRFKISLKNLFPIPTGSLTYNEHKKCQIFFPFKFDSPVLERALCRQNRISSTQSKLNKFQSQKSKKRYFLAFILIIFNIRLFFYWDVSILFIFIVKIRQS